MLFCTPLNCQDNKKIIQANFSYLFIIFFLKIDCMFFLIVKIVMIKMHISENHILCYLLNKKSKSKLCKLEIALQNLLGFLVAKLLYKSKCPSVCQLRLGGNVIFSAPN